MRDRLEKFIKTEGLTPSRFADIMGVQPSSISHILGGRNKPSFDFIEKMLQRFPKISPDWLLLGKGSMYRSNPDIPTAPIASHPAPNAVPINDIPTTAGTVTVPAESPGASSTTEKIRRIDPSASLFDFSETSTRRESDKKYNNASSPEIFNYQETNPSDKTAPENRQNSIRFRTTDNPNAKADHTRDDQTGPKDRDTRTKDDIRKSAEIERIVIFFRDKTCVSYSAED